MSPDTYQKGPSDAGCDGHTLRTDVDTYPEKIGPRCGQPHVTEITRRGWDRPIRLCPVHAERACLTEAETDTLRATLAAARR